MKVLITKPTQINPTYGIVFASTKLKAVRKSFSTEAEARFAAQALKLIVVDIV